MPVNTSREVCSSRDDWRTDPQRKKRWPSRHRGALTEKFNLHPIALDIAVAHQHHHVIGTQGILHRHTGMLVKRNHVDPEPATQRQKRFVGLCGFEHLDHCTHLQTALRQPPTSPFPATNMWHCENCAAPQLERVFNVRVTLGAEPGINFACRERRDSKRLEVVAQIALKRVIHAALHLQQVEFWRHAALMSLDHLSLTAHGHCPDSAKRQSSNV